MPLGQWHSAVPTVHSAVPAVPAVFYSILFYFILFYSILRTLF